jgi:hypothetical protein
VGDIEDKLILLLSTILRCVNKMEYGHILIMLQLFLGSDRNNYKD